MPAAGDIVSPDRKARRFEGRPSANTASGAVPQYNQNFAHFQPGRETDFREAHIPECARRIILAGHHEYLPLHYFAPEIRAQERRAMLVPKGIEPPVPRALVTEDNMSLGQYGAWSTQHVEALRMLYSPPWIVDMFDRHYKNVKGKPDYETAWTTWREYDLGRRAMAIGTNPPDIGRFNAELFSDVTNQANNRLREQMQALLAGKALPAAVAPAQPHVQRAPRPSTHTAGASASGASTVKRDPMKELMYECCILCGSRAHLLNKEGSAAKGCKSDWLVLDRKKKVWLTPDTHHAVCWAWNSPGGCKKDPCRLQSGGHRCSRCGATDHTCHSHV